MSGVPAPKFIFRGHQAAVHAATFVRNNERLATADAQGFVVLWDLMIMRARAVWKAHENAILGLCGWGTDKVITHGRDHKLIVWQIAEKDESNLSTALPLEGAAVDRPQPWMLHLLQVNTMNFCSFAACPAEESVYSKFLGSSPEILIAVPNTLASEAVDIFALPPQKRIHVIKPGSSNGMAMSLSLLHHQGKLTLIAAFENGYASVHQITSTGDWTLTYRSQAHSQPILSLDVRPDTHCFFTSGADSIIAKHPIPTAQQEMAKPFNPDERIVEEIDNDPPQTPSLLSKGLKEGGSSEKPARQTTLQEWKHPKKVINSKHSGQQSLQVRSDGSIFATAGWDSKIRVYSCKTVKELAVLKWHKEGAYAVTFASIGTAEPQTSPETETHTPSAIQKVGQEVDVTRMSVTDRRSHRIKSAHWIAAGAKDGRVSLWDLY